MILAHLTHIAVHPATLSFFQDEQQVGFSPLDLWHNMGSLAKGVVIVLFISPSGRWPSSSTAPFTFKPPRSSPANSLPGSLAH